MNKAFLELNKLIKLKYDITPLKVNIGNLTSENKISDYTKKEQQIILTLELLKTFLDVYNYHKTKNSLNFQIISNLLKHNNIKVIKKDIYDAYSSMGKYGSVSSDGPSSKKFEIDLEIDLKDKENSENQINIELDGIIINRCVIKMIKLHNGDLALAENNKILLFKNLKEEKNPLVRENEDIINFIQLNNNKIVIVLSHKIKIYKFVNQSLI